jgi:hypothetical protein
MARSRNIKPGFFQNDRLADCEPLARILFAGLWCEADREGRLEDRPKKIRAACLPYDECDCDDLLNQLAAGGFIVRYVVGGKGIIQVSEFAKHQNPHVKEAASSLPAPEKPGACTVQAEEIPERAGLIPSLLIPDSPIPSKQDQQPLPASLALIVDESRFDEFFREYPRDEGKKKAREAWARKKLEPYADKIISDVRERKLRHGQWLDKIIPHATTYINGERWNDAIDPKRNRPNGASHAAPQLSLADRAAAFHASRDRERDDARTIDGTFAPVHR